MKAFTTFVPGKLYKPVGYTTPAFVMVLKVLCGSVDNENHRCLTIGPSGRIASISMWLEDWTELPT
jgi:hypothetical protein